MAPPPAMRTVIAEHRHSVQRTAWAIGLGALLFLALALALADPVWADPGPARVEGRVVDLLGKPLAGANVHVVASGRVEQTVRTDADGRYRAELRGTGSYSLLFASGGKTAQKRTTIEAGTTLALDAELDVGPGEVIEVLDTRPATVPPKPMRDPRIPPQYSDRAILHDVWAKAWILLDVSATGEVMRIKVLKQPGHDLDDIAVRTAFGLKFAPGRDATGRAVPTYVVWGMEWPSMGWLQTFETATRIPDYDRKLFQEHLPAIVKVPCAGSGRPLQLGSLYPAYRDCSRPDLSLASKLPWLSKPR